MDQIFKKNTSGRSITSKVATYTAVLSDFLIKVDTTSGAANVNLFTAIGNNSKELIIKNMGTNNLTIDANGTETIDGSLTKILTNKYSAVNIFSDGANWVIV